jgi:hypothetical protein
VGVNAHAVIVGSNRGGPGQRDLRYAHEDARRVLELLTQVGGYAHGRVQLVLDPGRQDLLEALDRAQTQLRAHADRGEPSVFLFYYSGHARARALNMGKEELALGDLRQRLTSLSSTVTIAILDACQTGAISRVKGAHPAADFSYNSVNDLKTAGVAVMASSSASELSQEAESLRSSYFTHHLVVGLRGAADADQDGGVTLSEAYRYAYNRTLVDTARTAVGKQHVTLETRLRGKGEMTLTYPVRARSRLELPAGLAAQVLVHKLQKKAVVAELSKAAGKPVRLALPGGDYVAIVRSGQQVLRCELRLPDRGRVVLATERCDKQPRAAVGVKGEAENGPETWAIELGVGGTLSLEDDYTQQLDHFGFNKQLFQWDELLTVSVALSRRISPYLSLVAGWTMLDASSYEREVFDLEGNKRQQRFEWRAHGVGLYLRGTLPLLDRLLNPYLQVGGGLAWAATEYRDPLQASEVIDDQLHWGFHIMASAGVSLMPWRHFGFYGQASYTFAPVIENLVGDTHNSGGLALHLGVRGAL